MKTDTKKNATNNAKAAAKPDEPITKPVKAQAVAPKTIAIVGRPNVGKSSLFNRLAKARIAITSSIAGTTRDTNSTQVSISDKPITIIDTGGIEEKIEEKRAELFAKVATKAKQAAKEADLILYVVDGREIPSLEDRKLFFSLQKHTPCLLVVNKIDNDAQKEYAYNFAEFGTQEMYFISVTHNRGISILLHAIDSSLADNEPIAVEADIEEALLELLESPAPPTAKPLDSALDSSDLHPSTAESSTPSALDSSDSVVQIGIIGRVNVGKSSLLNALVGQERSVVSAQAGTTIDPVDEEIVYSGQTLRFIDTAGIRKKSKIQSLEKFALDRTSKVLEQADIAILVLDSSAPLVELDERIFSLVQKHALGVIVVWNKWDIKHTDFASMKAEFMRKFRFLEYAPFLTLSALRGRHIKELKDTILEVYANYSSRIPTAKLNDAIAAATKAHPIPSDHGKLVKIYYATQYATKPPQIALMCNRPKSLHFSYKRFLVNRLRKEFALRGTPVLLAPRPKDQRFDENLALENPTKQSQKPKQISKRSAPRATQHNPKGSRENPR